MSSPDFSSIYKLSSASSRHIYSQYLEKRIHNLETIDDLAVL